MASQPASSESLGRDEQPPAGRLSRSGRPAGGGERESGEKLHVDARRAACCWSEIRADRLENRKFSAASCRPIGARKLRASGRVATVPLVVGRGRAVAESSRVGARTRPLSMAPIELDPVRIRAAAKSNPSEEGGARRTCCRPAGHFRQRGPVSPEPAAAAPTGLACGRDRYATGR